MTPVERVVDEHIDDSKILPTLRVRERERESRTSSASQLELSIRDSRRDV